jgi:hypothetical protein
MIGDKVEPYLRFKHDGKQYRGEIDMAKWPKDPVDGNINAASTVTRVTFADATQSYNFPGIDPFSQFIDNAPILGTVPESAVASTINADIVKAFSAWAGEANINFIHAAVGAPATNPKKLGFQANTVEIQFGFANLGSNRLGNTETLTNGGQIIAATVSVNDPRDLPMWRIVGGDPFETTYSGDLGYIGTEATMTQILMHEIGHALGLPDNRTDPHSIMYYQASTFNEHLNASDVAAIQGLYGAPLHGAQPLSTQPAANPGTLHPVPFGDSGF